MKYFFEWHELLLLLKPFWENTQIKFILQILKIFVWNETIVKGEISRLFEEAESLETIVDVFKSMSYLANNAVYR